MATTKWVIDPAHSEIQFKVKHLMITNVTGNFGEFNGTAESEGDDFSKAKINFTAATGSITTGNSDRDAHLRSGDFFDAAEYPKIAFEASGNENQTTDDGFQLVGDLTIRGVSKKVKLNVDFGGIVTDPYGQTKAGFTISAKINRKDFGLTWGAVTEAGSVVVSDEVRIASEIQLIKQ